MDAFDKPKRPCTASVVIRTLNESEHLPRLLEALQAQKLGPGLELETVVVDSGSTDDTVDIARRFGCRIRHIRKEQFSFGFSLNVGCEFATGDVLAFVSGHCIPASNSWLAELAAPLLDGVAQYSYGRQIGAETTKFSENQLFAKYFPDHSMLPQDGFFCNNANAAITRAAWQHYKFNETVTGLEDMELSKRLVDDGGKVAYVATAPVHHIHNETWAQVRHRYEREALAMQRIAPNLHVNAVDAARFFVSGVLNDVSVALSKRSLLQNAAGIVAFRAMQYFGTYRGSREHRKISQKMKERYYYPTPARDHLGPEPEPRDGETDEQRKNRLSAI